MADLHSSKHARFGTAPVFLTAISTILGAIMFLRFGYAVGHVGFLGVLLIILIGHLVTIPTAMAIAEIATNQKVEGGGEYFIISRSFGLTIGAAIGISLYLSQAVSVAFYVIAFAEAFDPLIAWVRENYGVVIGDKRWISLPATVLLTLLITLKGADLGVKALYAVVAVLFAALGVFFLGSTEYTATAGPESLIATIENADPFFLVFAICFPAFTGMTAGVGLSGNLRNPRKSIPVGTLAATLVGMIVYVLIAYKLSVSASPADLASDQLIMSKIAVWGFMIPLGLASATISSALGSFMVAPRTLQAIGEDRVLPLNRLSAWLSQGKGETREPFNASLVTAAIAVTFVLLGDVNFVAQIISMFFMVTYGSICLISFLEHFAADPSYRPTFRSRWFVSFFGAVLCGWLMFQMSTPYAVLAIVLMFSLYQMISYYNKDKQGLSNIVQGAIFQISRQLHIFLQKSRKSGRDSWRPSVVCLTDASFKRLHSFDLMRWISHRYGFGTYIHHIEGYLSRTTWKESQEVLERLVTMASVSESNIYVDTIVSPSYTTTISQIIQLPGISGKENNMLLLEFSKDEPEGLKPIVENYQLVASTGFDVCILGISERGFGYRREIHIWLSPDDYENESLMIVLAYILLGHPDWKGASIKIFSVLPSESLHEEEKDLRRLIRSGRLPISEHNVEVIPQVKDVDRRDLVRDRSKDADLIIVGFRAEAVKRRKQETFTGYEGVGNVLFVNTKKDIALAGDKAGPPSEEEDADAAELTAAQANGVKAPQQVQERKGTQERPEGGANGA